MTITADWQGELRSVTFGRGTDYPGIGGIGGLGIPGVRAVQERRGVTLDGDTAGPDTYQPRILTIPMVVLGDDEADTAGNLRTLKAAWRLRRTGEEELTLRVPSIGEADGIVTFYGRPRGFDVNVGNLKSSVVQGLAEFHALDPLAYGPDVVIEDKTTGWTLDADGDTDTDRITLVVTCDGTGPPNITNTTNGTELQWDTTPAAAQVRTVRIRPRTVGNAYTNDAYVEVSPTSRWLTLQPGNNVITIDNISSLDLTYEPAYL